MDRRLLILALGMFALGTDSFVVAGVLPEAAIDPSLQARSQPRTATLVSGLHFVGGAPAPVSDIGPCGCSLLWEWVARSAVAGPVKPSAP